MTTLASIILLLYLWISVSWAQSSGHQDAEHNVCDSDSSSSTKPLRVAVIGAGPSGLFFCHALEKLMKQHGDRSIEVTVFEKSSNAGGLWQHDNNKNPHTIYDNMWTNGASFLHEFYDYTYEEHFSRPVDVYLPRQDVLDYILARVQRNSTNFLSKYIQFDTKVLHVAYSDEEQVFKVKTKDLKTGIVTSGDFEKCIWAAGGEGVPKMPRKVVANLRKYGFQGRVMHSSDMSRFEQDVRGKRILLIGGGLSTEDLALQAIKCGVNKVVVASRNTFGPSIASTTAWPDDKVEVLLGWQLASIPANGESTVILESVKYDEHYVRNDVYEDIYLDGIETIIFCTGYKPDMNMLEKSLRKGKLTYSDIGKLTNSDIEGMKPPSVAEDWSMEENCMTWRLGEIEPSYLYHEIGYRNPFVYRGLLISNRNMMFLSHLGSETPLLAIDVLGYIYGSIDLPTAAEMQQANMDRFSRMMDNPFTRMFVDEAYSEALEEWIEYAEQEARQEAADEMFTRTAYCFDLDYFHQLMVDAKYPLRLVGPEGLTCPSDYPDFEYDGNHPVPKGLTELGYLFVSMEILASDHRTKDPTNSKAVSTFRDYTNGFKFRSLFTGKEARSSLPDQWVNL